MWAACLGGWHHKARDFSRGLFTRQILEAYITENTQIASNSLLDSIADLAGVLNGPADLSSNPDHLDGYGE